MRLKRSDRTVDAETSEGIKDPRGNIDVCWQLSDGTVVVDGWLDAPHEDIVVRRLDGSGRVIGETRPFKKHRPDVCTHLGRPSEDVYGFLACLPATSGGDGLRVRLEVAARAGPIRHFEVHAQEGDGFVGHLLRGCIEPDLHLTELVRNNAVPLVRHDGSLRPDLAAEVAFQSPLWREHAMVNVVIPLFANFNYLRNQLLSLEQAARELDLVVTLVCDDPLLETPLLRWLLGWSSVYRLPIQCVTHKVNAGFAQACNTGATAANAEFVFLLNSDVLPQCPEGWSCLIELASDPATAVVAPVLTYPDGSLQHAGMELERNLRFGQLLPRHPGKGLPLDWLAVDQTVPYLSGAALLFRSSDYEAVGGMPLDFGRGDFEDVLFSLRMSQLGALRIDPRVKWVHIEGGSHQRAHSGAVVSVLAKSIVLEELLTSASEGAP